MAGRYPLADRILILDGQLPARLRELRAAGTSFEAIARDLEADGIVVSRETVRTWCRELGIDTARAAS